MGCFSGPKVESSQLVAAFDAANSKGFDAYENLLSHSENFGDGYWSKVRSSISSNVITAPDGTLTADKLISDTSNNDHYVRVALAGLTNSRYTISVYAKAAEHSYLGINANVAGYTWITFNLSNGTVVYSESNAVGQIESVGNGWYRCSWISAQSSTALDFSFSTSPNSGGYGQFIFIGDNTSGIYLWGAQLETSSSTGPYYATTAAPKTRGITLSDLSGRSNTGALTYGPTYNSTNGGAIVFDGSNDCVVVNSNASVLSNTGYTKTVWFYITSFATNNNLISGGNNGRHAFSVSSSNKLQAGHNSTWNTISSPTPLSLNTWYHAAVTFSTTTGWRLYLNGVLDSTNTSTSTVFSAYDVADALFAEVPYGVGYGATTTFLGSGEILLGGYGTGSNGFSGRISNASVYNRVLSASEIQQNYNALAPRFTIVPPIVTSGLVLNLDAGNAGSYSGSGTTWIDISGNNNTGTLVNGPTYSSANGGSLVFDGVNDYVLTPVNIDANPNTVSAWFNASATNGARGIVITDNGNWDKGFEITDGVFNIHVGDNLSSTGVSALSNTWYFGTIVYTSISMSFYINGANIWNGGAPGGTSGSTVEIGRANYNAGAGSRFFIGNISNTQIYNRALSAAEIQQNFNATRGRFGI